MKKIEIVTFNRAHNYGALLQAYALQKKISEKYNVEVLDYRCEKIESGYKKISLKGKKIKNKIISIIKYLIFFRRINKKYDNFSNFINRKLKLSDSVYDKKDVITKCKNVDIFVTGSDQVWNLNLTGGLLDLYTLNFDYPNAKKISYAASVGDVNLIKNNQKEYCEKISKLDCISVREDDACKELSKIINKPIDLVLDPTLLLCKNEWEMEIKDVKREKEKYILAYVVTLDEEYLKIVNDLSMKTGLPVIYCEIINRGYNNTLKTIYTEGPLEFINYIKNAEYVVSTSFHATVFSIIFNKKFFIVPHRNTGARVTNLLNKLGISGRTFSSYDEFKNIDYNFDTNWIEVNKKLNEEREKSISWLDKALDD